MFFFRTSIYRRTVAATWQTFGWSRELLVYVVRRPLASALMHFALGMDHLFAPAFRRVKIERPLFILGHPRSGTTFLHRLLTQTGEFCVFQTWEVHCPSITLRKLVRPFVSRFVSSGRGQIFAKEEGHELALDSVEEEEMLFFLINNTQFLACLTPLAFSSGGYADLVFADDQPHGQRRHSMVHFKGCLQRQIYDTGKPQIVAKSVFSGMRIRTLLEAFPDARFVYLVRSPLETIPSHLTLDRNVFARIWGLDRIPGDRLQAYFQRRYEYDLAFYHYLEELSDQNALPEERVLVLPYPDLRSDLEGTIARVAAFSGLQLSESLRARIASQSRAQASYQREHENLPLEEFGLSRERVLRDFDFIFKKYGFAT